MSTDELAAMISDGRLLPADLSREQYLDWVFWEPPPVPLTSFHLGDEDHRREFLWEYFWQGEPTLFAAVAHVWDSLEGEREAHCTLVGLLSGTGGKGKTALVLTLQQFLRECLDGGNALLPERSHFPDLHSWSEACRQSVIDDEAHARALCVRYSAILDGRMPEKKSGLVGQVLQGPWK